VFVRATSRAAARKLSIYHYCRQTANAVLFRTSGNVMLMHVVDMYLVPRARDLLNQVDGLLTRHAPRTEDFNFSFFAHDDRSFALS